MTDDNGALFTCLCAGCQKRYYKQAFDAGRKAERERCLRILRSHQGKCEEILLTDYLEAPF